MEDVPKTVLRRLGEAAPVEGHPDADLLTAFAEQSLDESERREVLRHLARCGDCREVLSLALPASEAVILPDFLVARSGWLSWPVLRWGVVAAGIILVASVGVIQYQGHHQDQAMLAKSTVPQLTAAFQGSLSSSQAASSQGDSSPSVAAPDASAKKMELRKEAPANAQQASSMKRRATPSTATQPPMSPPDAAGAISAYGIGIDISSPNASARNPSLGPIEKSDLPGASQMVEVQTETAQAVPAISDVTHERLSEDSKGQQTQARELTDSHAVGKAKDPVPAQAQSASASAPTFAPATVPLPTSTALMRWASPRWTITPAGGLQRSFDDGQTWEDVNVVAAESVGHRSEIGKTASQKAVTEYKNRKSTDENADKVLPGSNLIFRAVAAIGSEVWAGGLNTILYHSVDSGAGWIKVLPSQTGAVLTGDITSIDFSDLQHGRILTSTREAWLTANDGETWEKQ